MNALDSQINIINRNIFELIKNNITDLIIYVNKDGDIIYKNNLAENNPLNLFSYSLSKDLLNNCKFFDSDGNLLTFENYPIQRVLRGEFIHRYKILVNSICGTFFTEVTGNPIYDESGDLIGCAMIYRDLTDRVKVQEMSSVEKVTKHLIINYADLTYPDFKITYINDKGFACFRESNKDMKLNNLSEIIGKGFFELYRTKSDKNHLKDSIIKAFNNGNTSFVHCSYFVLNSENKFLKTVFQPEYNSDNEITNVIAIALDITNEEKEKEELEQNLKMQEDMLVNTSHELKTPLNLIYSSSQMIDFYLSQDKLDIIKDSLVYSNNIIKQNCYRLTRLINNIVDYSRAESGNLNIHLVNGNIVRVVNDIVESVKEYAINKNLVINFNSDIEEKIISFDPFIIERVLLNLISNAIKYTDSGGNIDVNIIDKIDTLEISVSDTGIGIDDKYKDKIFEKFRQIDSSLTRRAEGFGIGLPLVKSLMELHNGNISVNSSVGVGSTFIIELPASKSNDPFVSHSKINNYMSEVINYEFSDIYD